MGTCMHVHIINIAQVPNVSRTEFTLLDISDDGFVRGLWNMHVVIHSAALYRMMHMLSLAVDTGTAGELQPVSCIAP